MYGNFGRGGGRSFGARREGGSSGGSSYDGGFERRAPVKEGEEIDVKIEAIASKGDGIAKKDGFVIFVPKTKIGDEVKIRISKVMRRVAFAEVVGQGAPKAAAPAGEEAAPEEPAAEDSDNFGESEESTDEPDYSQENDEIGGDEEPQ